jgi:hypothetical protein
MEPEAGFTFFSEHVGELCIFVFRKVSCLLLSPYLFFSFILFLPIVSVKVGHNSFLVSGVCRIKRKGEMIDGKGEVDRPACCFNLCLI